MIPNVLKIFRNNGIYSCPLPLASKKFPTQEEFESSRLKREPIKRTICILDESSKRLVVVVVV